MLSATCTSPDAQFAGVIIANGCDVLSWVLVIGLISFLESGCQEQEGEGVCVCSLDTKPGVLTSQTDVGKGKACRETNY